MYRAILIVSVFLASAQPVFARCSTTPFQTVPGSESSANMQAPSGKRCVINMRAHSRTAFVNTTISQQARSGTATVLNQTQIAYQSKLGYRGADAFAFTLHSQTAQSTVRISVTVE